jgi:hypothetical protein
MSDGSERHHVQNKRREEVDMIFLNSQLTSKSNRTAQLFAVIGLTEMTMDGVLFCTAGISAEVNATQCFQVNLTR